MATPHDVAIELSEADRAVLLSWTRRRKTSLPLPDACRHGHLTLVLCYGISGFGYIVPATYLPAMARQQIADPMIFGLIWPLFGLMAAVSVMLSAHYLAAWSRERVGAWLKASWHWERPCWS